MQNAEIYCLRVHPAGFGFGARVDTGEQVYLPQSVTVGAGVSEGEVVMCSLIVNTHPNNTTTPWVAIRVDRGAGTSVPSQPAPAPIAYVAQPDPLEDRVLRLVEEVGMITTSEVVAEFSDELDSQSGFALLLRLFTAGKLAKADSYARPDQGRASFCMWAVGVKVFAGEEV